jgi:Rrf2 family protein
MFISKNYDYAIRIFRALSNGEQLTISEICKREHIPQAFASKITNKLREARMIEGVRGINGGYKLSVLLSSVNLYDVGIAVEGTITINKCLREDTRCPNSVNGKHCTVKKFLNDFQNEIIHKLKQQNMEELLVV